MSSQLHAIYNNYGFCNTCNAMLYLGEDDLWGEVLWSATEGPRTSLHTLCKPKVCYLRTG